MKWFENVVLVMIVRCCGEIDSSWLAQLGWARSGMDREEGSRKEEAGVDWPVRVQLLPRSFTRSFRAGA